MDDIASLDEVNLRLAEIQGELWDLEDDDYGTRYDLKLEQDRLRAVVRKFVDPDEHRPTDELIAELEARASALARIQETAVASAAMTRGAGTGTHAGPGDAIVLNAEIRRASRARQLAERIARLETLLSDRDALKR